MARIRAKAWMAGTSPAMTQVIEIYKYRHARPRAGHPLGAAGTAVLLNSSVFPHPAKSLVSLGGPQEAAPRRFPWAEDFVDTGESAQFSFRRRLRRIHSLTGLPR
jgi:hypothetical protein